MAVRLIFRGGAGTVTGSCALIEHPGGRLMVDCGMFQGNRTTRELNYAAFPFDAAEVDHLLLTHAHIDHSGLIPKLALAGFDGPVHATAPTLDLLRFMLPDSGAIQEGEVRRLNARFKREGKQTVAPIYTREDAEAALTLGRAHPLEEWFDVGRGARARFWNAGHMLGSASVELAIEDGGARPLRLLFSGDLGPDEKAFHAPPDAPEGYDYVVCESTYGDREREDQTVAQRREALRAEIVAAMARGGNLVIPSFAVERSQELLHDIGVLLAQKAIPNGPVFLDSPLASRVTEVFARHAGEFDDIDLDEAELFRHPSFRITESVEDSMAINRIAGGAIVISASGMADAGRIKHHLRNNLWRGEATVLFVGYQAPGTLGERILSGAPRVRIHGRDVEVRATIRSLQGYSAHADQGELARWVLARRPIRAGLFLNHGEDEARHAFKALLEAEGLGGAEIHLPELDDAFALRADDAPLREATTPRVDPARLRRDWADDHVDFTLRLARALDAAPDPASRERLMGRLRAVLDEAGG
ncbi:MAG: MBL fold metallo-hydrolase [Rubrimonas sp.]|uniref:MBL fold metallo-hydrolase n=1 Tax=Rubrimonas sp. TaxID=2036015 RepID=UPI002FDD1E54